MAILSRPKLAPQQRFDLEDWNALLAALCGDSKLYTQKFWSANPLILNGFVTSGIGNTSATVNVAEGALVAAGGANDQSWFVAAASEPDKTVALQAGLKNYLEISLDYVGNNELLRAFWDATANGGVGAEFNQLTETINNLEMTIETSISGFSGDANKIPIAIVETNGGGSIVSILDQRKLFWRLGQPQDEERNFAWGTIEEPTLDLTLSGITGTFTVGETVTFDGAETAEVVAQVGSTLSVKDLSSPTFSIGDTILGASSGESGTLDQALDSFTGADKDVKTLKDTVDALMTEIKVVKGTKKWFESPSSSLVGIADFMNSQMVQASAGARFAWDGSELSITDSALSPADADIVGYLRQMGKATDMELTRQSAGLEVQKIVFDAVPDSGSMTLEHNGDTSDAINAGDDASAVQTAINAQWTAQVTVTGDFANGFTMTFDVAGDVVEMTEASNTLQASASSVTTTISTIQNGYAGGSTVAIGLDQVMFIKVPAAGDRTFDGVGSGDTNYQVVDRSAFIPGDENYWIAFNEGGVLYVRGRGELEAGEESNISDPDKETILAQINANTARDNQDRTSTLIEGGTWSLAGNDLTLSADAYISMGGLEKIRNTIVAQTITLPNANSVAYVSVNRDGSGASNLQVQIADVENLILTDGVFIIARKIAAGVLVGSSCFQLKDGERLELEGSLAEINRLLGQMKIDEHESDADKARISTSEITQLDGTTLNQIIGNFLLRFDGAVIDFTTGEIFESDGSTPLGNDFTPPTIPASEYHWFGISLLPGSLNALNEQLATVQIDIAESSDAAAGSAVFPVISGTIKRGWVQVQNNGGNIEVNDIKRLGVGSGSGSGGAGGSARDAYEDRLNFSTMLSESSTAFNVDQDDFIDVASTGSNSPADDNAFKFSAIGETMIDTNNATSGRFLASETDLLTAELMVRWKEGAIDPAATYELSRDGGNEYQAVTMERVGTDSNAFRGFHIFDEEAANQTLDSQTTPDANRELTDTGSGVERAVPMTPSTVRVIKNLDLDFNKLEAVAGNLDAGKYSVQIVRDDSGAPSTDPNDIITETNQLNISDLASGSATESVAINSVVLLAGVQVWIVVKTDAAYKAAFSTGVDALSVRVNSLSPTQIGQVFDGTTWSATAGEGASYVAEGREVDLRVRVTSSAADVLIESYGVGYHEQAGKNAQSGEFDIDLFTFSGDENKTVFPLVNIQNPIPGLLQVYDVTRGQTYTDGETTFRMNGSSLVFEPNFFDDPGESITLKVIQIKAGVIDNSDTNAGKIAEINSQLLDIGDQLESVSDSMVLAKIAAPFTTVQNRSEMPDLSSDLKPRMAPDRIMTQELVELQDEVGPNGEPVFGVVNDKFNQIRFVGNWKSFNGVSGLAPFTSSGNTDDYMEVVFYGTGLNILTNANGDKNFKVIIDGGVLSADKMPSSKSAVLTARNYTINQSINAATNLSLGLHTIKIFQSSSSSSSLDINGFEILNESSDIYLPPGAQLFKGRRLTKATGSTTPYNSDFESGTLGTRGGHVLIYQKADGTVAKAVNPTDAAQANLSAANHANEEIIRKVNWREFGAGRTDDFSTATAVAGNKAFTLDDGTTTLVGEQVQQGIGPSGKDHIKADVDDFITLTFVGTGLDLLMENNSTRAYEIFVDGASIGIMTSSGSAIERRKIVSGLPYGTHTVKFQESTGSLDGPFIFDFILYGPAKPTLPAGSKAISDYFLMADFVANTVAGIETVSTGALRKFITREMVYVNGTGGTIDWNLGSINPVNHIGALAANTNRGSAYNEYTFFGTGFDLRYEAFSNRSNDIQVFANGTPLTAANFPTAAFSTYGGTTSYNSGTGELNQIDAGVIAGAGFVCSGLPLNTYTIRFNNQTASTYLVMESLDVITPIHSPKQVGPKVLQAAIEVGSQGIRDLRKFSKKDVIPKTNSTRSKGITAGPSTTSTSLVPQEDMQAVIETSGGDIEFTFNAPVGNDTNGTIQRFAIYVDGKAVSPADGSTWDYDLVGGINIDKVINIHDRVSVGPGRHIIKVFWSTNSGTTRSLGSKRTLNVKEVF